MAGNKVIDRVTTIEDGIKDKTGAVICGLPIVKVVINGNVETNDEWILYRLTDDGVAAYRELPELRSGIMSVLIAGENAGEEVARFKTEGEAVDHLKQLPPEEKLRTLVRSVRPK